MLVRIFQEPSGKIRIVRPNARTRRDGESDQVFIERVSAEAIANDPSLAGLPFKDIDESAFPSDRKGRDRWRLEGEKIVVLAEK